MVGEHIRALKAGRWNHAIDCGDETVIHLADDGLSNGARRIRRSYRPEFVSGADTVEVVTHRERTFPASEVVARAYSRISESALAAMFRDSEAFAEWCTTGRLPAPPNVALAVPAASRASAPPPARAAAAPGASAAKAKPATAAPAKAKPAKRAPPKRAARSVAKRGASARRTKKPARAPARPARKAPKRAAKKRR